MEQSITIGSRGSALALAQSELVRNLLHRCHPDIEVQIEVIRTTGDVTSGSLRDLGGIGVFTKEIENSLLEGHIDLAVHSLKDLPTELHEDLRLVAVPEREDVRDVLISRPVGSAGSGIDSLPAHARIGTGSRRRQAQLRALRRDLEFTEVRGNLDTRIGKVSEGTCDAVVLAAAGLHRLGWRHRISAYLDTDQMLPAPGQGALGLQMRGDDPRQAQVAVLNHPVSCAAVAAERALLRDLGGGCRAPIAAWGRLEGTHLVLDGLVGDIDGSEILRSSLCGDLHAGGDLEAGGDVRAAVEAAEQLGSRLGRQLRQQGADAILAAADESP